MKSIANLINSREGMKGERDQEDNTQSKEDLHNWLLGGKILQRFVKSEFLVSKLMKLDQKC